MSRRATEAERELRWAKEGRESAERREGLVRKELEAVRRQLAATPGPSAGSGDPERVKELESLLQSYKTTLEEIHRDSRDAEERIAKGMGLVKSQDLDKAQDKISQLEEGKTCHLLLQRTHPLIKNIGNRDCRPIIFSFLSDILQHRPQH